MARYRRLAAALLYVAAWLGTAAANVDPDRACIDCIDPQLLARLPNELRYQRMTVPDDLNGFVALRLAASTLVERPEGMSREPPSDGWIRSNRVAFELLDDAIYAPGFQLPLWDVNASWHPYRTLALLKLARARWRIAHGDIDGAVQDITDTFTLSQRMLAGDPVVLTYLVSMAIEKFALSGMREIVADSDVAGQRLGSLVEILQVVDPCAAYALALRVELTTVVLPDMVGGDLSSSDARIERILAWAPNGTKCRKRHKCMSELRRELRVRPDTFDPSDTVDIAGQLVAAEIKNCRVPPQIRDEWRNGIIDPCDVLDRKLAAQLGFEAGRDEASTACSVGTARTNPVGRSLLRMTAYGYYPTRVEAERNATMVLLAARHHEIKTGRLPDTLSELVDGGYLRAIPRDPYADTPLSYSAVRRSLWSVGEDRLDQDGTATEGDAHSGDLVWTIPPAH